MEQEQKPQIKTTKKGEMSEWQMVIGIIAIIGTTIFIWNGFVREDNPPVQHVQTGDTTEDILESPKVNGTERTSALSLVTKTVDKDLWMRSEAARTYEDVYKNPNGEGYVVWFSDDRSNSFSFTYLVKNGVVYAITPDAQFMSPSVALTTEVTVDDLKEIKKWRLSDYAMRYTACIRHSKILERNGLVEKRVAEQRSKCEAQYSN